MLLTRRGGYVLELEPDQLDAAVFELRLEEGRVLLAQSDPAAASARLAEGLHLWRGPPLADLAAVEELQPEIRRLEELRLLAEMERIDAELALGHAAEAVVELDRLIAAAPLQERLRGQLMVALYRSGRQAEALAAYRETCALLRDELGLTPSAELRELECMILRHDAGLEADGATAAARPAGAVPVQGPGRIRILRCGVLLRARSGHLRPDRAAGRVAAGRDPRAIRDREVLAAARRRAPGAPGRGAARQCAVAPGAAATRGAIRSASSSARSAGSSRACSGSSVAAGGWCSRSTSSRSCSRSATARWTAASSSRGWRRSPATTNGGCCSCARCARTSTAGSARTRPSPS